MAQKILQVKAKLVVSPEEFEKDNGVESAQEFKNLNIPGLLWKIGYLNRETMEAGGIYLFRDEAALRSYIEGPIVAQLRDYPLWTGMSVNELDILVEFSKVMRAPIGEKFEREQQPFKTFNQMAAEAFDAVPMVKPDGLHRWMQQQPRPLIIDVQDAADIAQTGSIPGAINLSLGSLTYKADHELPEEWRDARLNNRGMLIVVTCGMGPLGALGGKLLRDMGFTNVYLLDGGVSAWVEAGYPTAQPV